eukprot:1159656-Pelagomonas_calceolata.AAC.10
MSPPQCTSMSTPTLHHGLLSLIHPCLDLAEVRHGTAHFLVDSARGMLKGLGKMHARTRGYQLRHSKQARSTDSGPYPTSALGEMTTFPASTCEECLQENSWHEEHASKLVAKSPETLILLRVQPCSKNRKSIASFDKKAQGKDGGLELFGSRQHCANWKGPSRKKTQLFPTGRRWTLRICKQMYPYTQTEQACKPAYASAMPFHLLTPPCASSNLHTLLDRPCSWRCGSIHTSVYLHQRKWLS